jgi:hypothetical protein
MHTLYFVYHLGRPIRRTILEERKRPRQYYKVRDYSPWQMGRSRREERQFWPDPGAVYSSWAYHELRDPTWMTPTGAEYVRPPSPAHAPSTRPLPYEFTHATKLPGGTPCLPRPERTRYVYSGAYRTV